MPTYQYKARDKFGKAVSGVIAADTENAVSLKLSQSGYTPISIGIKKEITIAGFLGRFKRVRFSELNMFTRQLAALQKAGLPLLSSLNAIRDQVTNKLFKDTITNIIKDIEAGSSFSETLAKSPNIFEPLYVNMIAAGETSGNLEQSLERLANLGEHDEMIRLRIRSATRYPVIVVITIIVGFLILTTLVIPRFARIYSQFSANLPLPTQILLGIHYAITKFWWLLILIIIAATIIFKKFINTDFGRNQWDAFKLKVPIFGPLVLKLSISRFTRITGTLMHSGVPLLKILELASSGAGNVVIARAIDNIKANVLEGKGMSEPIRLSNLFTPVVVQMVSIGEETGKLDELLIHVSNYYDSQVDYTINNLTSLIEPLLIFFLGGVVLFMALGIFLPMWNLMNVFKR